MNIAKYALSSRWLAFLATMCSIATVAWVSDDAALLWVGAGGLAAGNIYMWRTRYAVSRVRTGVLLALLLVLLAVLGRDMLLSWTGDPLLVSRYLVYGLIVCSFDMRTRRHVLGTLILASMIFVLLSPTGFGLWFPLLAGGFVLFSLAAAVVGYRDEEGSRAVVVGGGGELAAGMVWLPFGPSFVVLTGAVFLLMPRFELGGLTPATWLPSRIDLTAAGSAFLPSRPGAAVSPDILVSQQLGGAAAGRYVPLGYVGSAGDAVVMHVRSRVPSYWRGSTLDRYDGMGWLPSISRLALVNEGLGEFVFPDSDLRPLSPRSYFQTYYLTVDQPNAVFTGYNPGRVYLSEEAQTFLQRGTVYRAVSQLPSLSPALLRRDRADTTDSAYLALPPISARTAELADAIVRGASTDYDKAARLEQFLLRNYPYDLGVQSLTPGRDAVDVFLFEQQAGYCAQFATAMAVMARHVGLPARVAVGYLPGLYDPMTGAYAVRAGDAHAWVEIRFRRSGWVAFDPTPRPDLALPSGAGSGLVSFGLTDLVGAGFSRTGVSRAGLEFLARLRMPGWTWLALLGAAVAIAVVATVWVSRRGRKARRTEPGYTSLAGDSRQEILRIYRKMVGLLARKGLPHRQPAQTPREYAHLVASWVAEGRDILDWLTEAATVAAYDPRPVSPSTAWEANSKLATLRHTLATNGSPGSPLAARDIGGPSRSETARTRP